MRLGWTEILIILAVVLVFFGGKRLPELGKALGKSLRGFKEGVEGKGGDSEGSATSEGEKSPEEGAALRSSEPPPPAGTSSVGGNGSDSGNGSGVAGN